MKKIGIIALLCIFLFNTAGYYLVFLVQQMQIKREIRSQIHAGVYDKNFTSVITINRADLASVEFRDAGAEMVYNDNMYDIVKTSETANEITYYCINDSHEESLLAILDKHIRSHVANKPLKGDQGKKSCDNPVKLYFSLSTDICFDRSSTEKEFSSFSEDRLSAPKQNSTPPPPEFC